MTGVIARCKRHTADMQVLLMVMCFICMSFWHSETIAQENVPKLPSHLWMGMDGQPLPAALQSDEAIKAFLQTAEVISMKTFPVGVTKAKRVVLEKDGVRMRAFFKDVDIYDPHWKSDDGKAEIDFRDYYGFECAAYILSRMLNLDNIPPVVKRRIGDKEGSLQIAVEYVIMARDRDGRTPPDSATLEIWSRQMDIMWNFDNLVYNVDRNMGDILIDAVWRLWMIDYSRAFRWYSQLLDPELITRSDRCFFEALQTLDEDEVKQKLKPYLDQYEIDGLLKRRQNLVTHIQKLIKDKGEQAVLFELH